jgi:hypothetical protein
MSDSCRLMRTRAVAALTTFVLVWALFAALTVNVSGATGGDDVFGYTWTDSNAPTPSAIFSWVDITGTGTASPLTGDDEYSSAVPIGFTFPYYDSEYTNVFFSTNGFITFGAGSSDYSNDPVPSANSPNLFVAPFWDDLMVNYAPYNTGVVYYETIGVAPDREFVVEYWQVSRFSSYTLLTFEAILTEAGEICFQYLQLNGLTGDSATVGIEDATGTSGCEYSYNSAVLSDSLAVVFTPPPTVVSPQSQEGRAQPGDSVFYDLSITNYKSVSDSYDITGESDAGWTMAFLDSMHNPLTDSNSNGVPDTGDVPGGSTVDISVRVYVPPDPLVQNDLASVTVTSYVEPTDSTTVEIRTKALGARLAPPYSEAAVDTDEDGLYNILEMHVPVDVAFDGYYALSGGMYDIMASHVDTEHFEGHLDAGETVIVLEYEGWKMNMGGHDGPYDVELELIEYDGAWWGLDSDVYTTNSYTADEFDEPPASLEPPYADYGKDSNSNGYYDSLVVVVPVNVTGNCDIYLRVALWDEWLSYIDDVEIETSLVVGIHEIEASFDGRDLWDYGHDGFYIAEILLETSDGDYLDDDVYSTDSYGYLEFEPPGASLALGHSDYGLDTNGNDYYDYLVIDAHVHVFTAGTYTVNAWLMDGWMGYIDFRANTSHLGVGIHSLELRFNGRMLYQFGYDGMYNVDFTLWEADSDEIDWGSHETDGYAHDEFEPPGIALEPPHSDYATDVNENSYYDSLIVNVSVNVSTPGNYDVYVVLWDNTGWFYITEAINESYLEEGVQQVQVTLHGLMIYNSGYDGPYQAEVGLHDGIYWVDWGLHITSAYLWSDFEPPGATFLPPHDDNGFDTDDDGVFDYLSVNASLDVATSGDYIINAYLWPINVWETVETYLDVGTHVVEILFDGRLVNVSGYEGAMEVGLWLYDSDWINLDYNLHVTGAYSCDDFRGAPIEFSAPHEDYGLNTTGGDDFEYLVVNVSVEVGVAGVYTVAAVAFSWIDVYAQAEAFLEAGTQSVSVMFPAWPLYASGFSGLYMVELYLVDEDGTEWSHDVHETGSYDFSDFNGTTPTISSTWTEVAPSIDGVMEPGEWDGSSAVDLVEADAANELDSMMIVMNNATHLFLCYDAVGDTSEDEDDVSSFSFDTGNDGITTNGAEDQFEMYCAPDSTAHYSYDGGWWSEHCSPFDPELPNHEGLAGAYGFGPSEYELADHRIFEYSIPLALIDASPGDVLGFCGASSSVPAVVEAFFWEYSTWPNYYGMFPELNQFGDLVLAPERPTTSATVEGTMGDGWYVSGVTVTLHSTGGDGGIDYTMYRVNGGDWETYVEPFELSTPGTVLVEFYSVDVMGNEEEVKSTSFAIEDLEPNTLMALIGGKGIGDYYVTPSVMALLTASDDSGGSGVASTMYRLDGGAWTEYPAGGVEIDGDGNHTIEFYSVDNVGNEEAVHSETILIDCTAPSTTASVSGSNVTLTSSDDGSGVAFTMYRIDGGAWVEYDGVVSVTAAGNHTVDFYSVDAAGNTELVDSATVQNEPSDESGDSDEEGGISAIMSGVLGLIIGAVVVAVIMMMLMRKKQPGTPSASDEQPTEREAEDDLPPPPS